MAACTFRFRVSAREYETRPPVIESRCGHESVLGVAIRTGRRACGGELTQMRVRVAPIAGERRPAINRHRGLAVFPPRRVAGSARGLRVLPTKRKQRVAPMIELQATEGPDLMAVAACARRMTGSVCAELAAVRVDVARLAVPQIAVAVRKARRVRLEDMRGAA